MRERAASAAAALPAKIYIYLFPTELKATHCELRGWTQLLFFFQCTLPTFATEARTANTAFFPSALFAECANERPLHKLLKDVLSFTGITFVRQCKFIHIGASFSLLSDFHLFISILFNLEQVPLLLRARKVEGRIHSFNLALGFNQYLGGIFLTQFLVSKGVHFCLLLFVKIFNFVDNYDKRHCLIFWNF
jgi:hypothetical protein